MRARESTIGRGWRRVLWIIVILEAGGAVGVAARQAESRVVGTTAAAEVMLAHDRLWTAWFANDAVSLDALLLPDFVAMNAAETAPSGRDSVLRAAAEFAAGGGRIRSISFPQRTVRRHGPAAVVYCSYALQVEEAGSVYVIGGRASVLFVQTEGGWVAAGWHLEERR